MTIDIIVPCYYSSEVIKPCFESIAQQTVIKDITVIMVNDCSPYTNNEYLDLKNEFMNKFKLYYYATSTHGGPAMARQIGLNHATSDWIMFVDDDDELYSPTVIEQLLKLANLENVISVTGQSKHQNCNEIMQPWIHHHGSIYNRKLLKINNIHYDPRLLYEEDGAFSRMILYTPDKYLKLKLYEPVYYKKYNPYSLTANENAVEEKIICQLGLATLDIQYISTINNLSTIKHSLFYNEAIIKNLLYLLAFNPQLELTKRQYSILLSFIIQYNNLNKNINPDNIHEIEIYEQSIKFQNEHFNFNNYRYSIDPVINYDDYYLEWLMSIFLKLK